MDTTIKYFCNSSYANFEIQKIVESTYQIVSGSRYFLAQNVTSVNHPPSNHSNSIFRRTSIIQSSNPRSNNQSIQNSRQYPSVLVQVSLPETKLSKKLSKFSLIGFFLLFKYVVSFMECLK